MAKILIPQDITEIGKQILREHGHDVVIGSGWDEETLKKEVTDCDALIVRTAKYPRSVLEQAKKLKVIARYGMGVDNIDMEAATELGIWVTNSPRSSINAVAEHTMLMLLAAAKSMYALQKHYRAQNPDYSCRGRYQGVEIAGKTLALVGVGRIGKEVAKKAVHGFGMNVIGYDPFVKQQDAPDGVTMYEKLEEMLPLADFVSLHMPLVDATYHLADERFFSAMKDGAFLLNMARGQMVDEPALIAALRSKKLRGAALDVLEKEPPEPDHPLFAMENVILTPHNASMTRDAMDIMGKDAAQSILEVLSGKTPVWRVNQICKCSTNT